ncbi:MAG TPA: heavy metal-responsive transcriptional regulator [Candidatus Dormibacteraeota bacterium]|nr:heavy metal-responsive transcriptional regulator [Candidatus Dormibacteraeota bacterium]
MEYIPQLRMPMLKKELTKTFAGSALRSGELAQLAGVSRDTLRHYERKGLLPVAQRSQNGYRHYPPPALDRVRLIRAALSIGFTVEELRDIFQSRDRGVAPCHQVHALAMEKARELHARIREMEALHSALQKAIRGWTRRLRSTAPGKRAGLLEMFIANHPESVRDISPMTSPGLRRRLQRDEGKKR